MPGKDLLQLLVYQKVRGYRYRYCKSLILLSLFLSLSSPSVPCTNGQFRLFYSSNVNDSFITRGRLEYCIGQKWASVCGRGFTSPQDAGAVCKKLNIFSTIGKTIEIIIIIIINIISLSLLAPLILTGSDIHVASASVNIVTLAISCIRSPGGGGGGGGEDNCTFTVEDNVESFCSHSDDIGLDCNPQVEPTRTTGGGGGGS